MTSLEKKITRLNKEIQAAKISHPNIVEVTCSQEDIEKTIRKKK